MMIKTNLSETGATLVPGYEVDAKFGLPTLDTSVLKITLKVEHLKITLKVEHLRVRHLHDMLV